MTRLMAIINITPDSFSGDSSVKPGSILRQIDAAIEAGANCIDIGAESTRPGAILLNAEEEWERLAPVMREITGLLPHTAFSLDTRHTQNAHKALAMGFSFINDVSGGTDPELLSLIKAYDAALIFMHALSIPADPKQTLPPDVDAADYIIEWAKKTIDRARTEGLSDQHIIIDPGIGFGKTPEQSLLVLQQIERFKSLGVTLLVGHSRKSFLSLFTDKPAHLRDPETVLVSRFLVEKGVDYLRVHDIASHKAMLNMQGVI